MHILFYFLFVSLLALLEPSVGPIPITLLFLILITIFYKQTIVFFLAVWGGIILDSLLFRPIGVTGLFFLLTVGLIFLYSRKFETKNLFFVEVMVSVSGILYELFFSSFSVAIFWKILLMDIVAAVLFMLITVLQFRLRPASS